MGRRGARQSEQTRGADPGRGAARGFELACGAVGLAGLGEGGDQPQTRRDRFVRRAREFVRVERVLQPGDAATVIERRVPWAIRVVMRSASA
jgi:hypothetical protein